MNGKEQRIAKLQAAQQQRKQDCIDRTEQAISKLLKNNERISFGNIAREANVSVSYLYKYPEVKERIQYIRDQQVKNAKKLTRPQTASEKSKQVIIKQLRERIKTLEYEKKELKKQNEKMTGELYMIGKKIDLFDSIKQENLRQAEKIKELKVTLELTSKELSVCQNELLKTNPKVISIAPKLNEPIPNGQIDNSLKAKISNLGIRINPTLKKIILSFPQQRTDDAISAVEEYLSTDKKVKSKAGLLRTALQEGWTPNLTDEEKQLTQVTDTFSEWFNLAKAQGIVKASRGTKEGILVMESTGEWTPLTTMIEKGWTLEYLQQRNKE